MHLEHWISEEGGLRHDDAVGWSLRLARTLAELHGKGRAHGAVSARALLTRSPTCTELGILLEPSRAPDSPRHHSAERAAGGAPSPADDVWAAGVVLYHALTGVFPFEGESDAQIKSRIEWAPPPPLAKHGCQARRAQRVLHRVFAPYRMERILTAHDLVVVLSRCLRELRAEDLEPLTLPEGLVEESPRVRAPEAGRAEPVDEPIIELASGEHPVPSESSQVLEAWLGEGDAEPAPSADESRELRLWLGEEAVDEAGTKEAVAELLAEVDRQAEREERDRVVESQPAPAEAPPPSRGRPIPPPLPSEAPPARSAPRSKRPAATRRAARSRRWVAWVAAAVGAAALYAALRTRNAAVVEEEDPILSPVPSPPPPASSSPPAPSTPLASASAAPLDRDACMVRLFAEGTFAGEPPSFAAICQARDPRKAAERLKTLVVSAGERRGVTDGMVEWSRLGWYEMAAFAVLHGRCCPDELAVPDRRPFNLCDFREALAAMHAAAREGDREALAGGAEAYRKAARCIHRIDLAEIFNESGEPGSEERRVFDKTLDRLDGR